MGNEKSTLRWLSAPKTEPGSVFAQKIQGSLISTTNHQAFY